MEWTIAREKHVSNPLSCSYNGSPYESLGCFPIGLDASRDDFSRVLDSQRRLRDLKLLNRLSAAQLHPIAEILRGYCHSSSHFLEFLPTSRNTISQLVEALARTNDDIEDIYQLQVYSALDSGFHTPSGAQFWAVWEVEPRTQSVIIYVSKSVQDIGAVLLHTHLSKLGFSRYQCFLAEYGLTEFTAGSFSPERLPERLQQDLDLLSSSDLLLYLQHLHYSEWDQDCSLLSAIRERCEELLIDVPTYHQLKKLSNMDYISGDMTDEQVVNAKLKWYRLSRLPTLDRRDALYLFREVANVLDSILWSRDYEKLDIITSAIVNITSRGDLDSAADFVLFCIFCAARKAGFEELYIEVSDRNPLFNQYSDQSAAFAELFALGSRCEAYFDIKPSDIGIMLSQKHRNYYNQEEHQPPMWLFNAPSFASAYAAAQTDIDPEQKPSVMPAYRRFTFLSVFAIPALVGEHLMLWPLESFANSHRHRSIINYWSWAVSQYTHGRGAAILCYAGAHVFIASLWRHWNLDLNWRHLLPHLHGILSRQHVRADSFSRWSRIHSCWLSSRLHCHLSCRRPRAWGGVCLLPFWTYDVFNGTCCSLHLSGSGIQLLKWSQSHHHGSPDPDSLSVVDYLYSSLRHLHLSWGLVHICQFTGSWYPSRSDSMGDLVSQHQDTQRR
jgi:hypothetical protein